MFRFVKQIFVSAMVFFSCNVLNVNPLQCVAMNNQECKIRPEIININSNESLFHPYSILTNKWGGSCNNINDPYAKLCVADVVKNINARAFNLMSRSNETRHIKWHETCKCKCRLDASVCDATDKLVEKCIEKNDENEMIHNDYRNACNSCTI